MFAQLREKLALYIYMYIYIDIYMYSCGGLLFMLFAFLQRRYASAHVPVRNCFSIWFVYCTCSHISIVEMHNGHVMNRSTFLAPLCSPINIFQSEFKYDIWGYTFNICIMIRPKSGRCQFIVVAHRQNFSFNINSSWYIWPTKFSSQTSQRIR